MPKAGERFALAQLERRFADLPPPLAFDEARAEASRCVYCFDAPCIRACPTSIDIPSFIRRILHDDLLGSAKTILSANIFGGSCARACPTEVLCEGACVDHVLHKHPVEIGRLQRFAVDHAGNAAAKLFTPGPATGKRVAIVGAGPAGLTCAHELRKHGHSVTVFEARDIAGGLNTLGIAAYKISTAFAMTEIEKVMQIGIDLRLNSPVSAADVARLRTEYDAVFLGIGLGRTLPLGIPGEDAPGVWESLDFIFQTHTKPLSECEIGKRVVVVGGGNTAVDVATAAIRLGAESVTMAYRRSEAAMPAFPYEIALAKSDGIHLELNAVPKRIVTDAAGNAIGLECARTKPSVVRGGVPEVIAGSEFILPADQIVKALGQEPLARLLEVLPGLTLAKRQIVVTPSTGATSIPGLYAGGDCIRNGGEIVEAVQDGKVAAAGIDTYLRERSHA